MAQRSHEPAHQRPLPRDYLPGGQKYHDAVNDSYRNGNPRQGMPVPEWIRQWEQIWERSGGKSNTNGKCNGRCCSLLDRVTDQKIGKPKL